MIPNVDQRIWIIFCWYLVLQCFFAGYDVVPTSSAAASSPNHEAAALDQSLRLLDDAELEMLGIRRPPGRSGSTYHETVTTTTTSSPSSSPSLSLFAPSRGSARINNNRKINLVSYTANLDNILNSLEDEDEEEDREDLEDDLDDLEEVVDRIPVSGAKLYERNHEAANAVQHRLLVNQIVQKYYPSRNHRRHRRSSALRRSARSSDLAQASSSSPSSTPKPPTESIVQQPSSSSSHQNNQHHQSSSVNYRTSDEHEQQHDSDNSDDKPEAESDGKKMAVKNAIRSNNSEHNFVRNATLANAQHSSSDKSRQRDEEATDVVPEVGQDQREATTATETNTSTMGAVTVTQAVKVAEAAATEVTKPERTAQQAADADAHRTMTPQEQQRPQTSYGSSSRPINVDSFNLLDDSVSVSNRSTGSKSSSSTTGNTAGKENPPKQQQHHSNNIFASENFDEQIIFLNGGDLLEANSVEQYDLRQFGKVERDVNHEFMADEPVALPLRPIIRGPSDEHSSGEDNMVIVYAEQHETATLACEVDADITSSVWLKDGQMVHLMDNKKSRMSDADTVRFARESHGGITISNVMMEDDGVWQCEAENARGFFFNGRPIKLVVLDPPKEPYLLIDQRRLDAGNMFIPVKENSELTLACVSEGGNPKPVLSWEVLLSPGIDRHAQKVSNDVLELQEIKREKDKEPSYKINTGAISEAKLPAVFRVHHNARILCVMEHPTLKMRQNASILLDVQYTPSFAITRTPGFGYPLREGIEVSLKCDVDSNPPSPPLWQKDDGDTPVPQTGDGFLNFSSIRREHSGWYKCTSRHLNFQYSSIGYYLSVRYDSVDVTSEPVEQDLPLSSSSSSSSASSSATSAAAGGGGGGGGGVGGLPNGANNFKGGQMEVELGGSVTLQCPQGSLGCWSHLDPITARLKGLGVGISTPTGQFSLKDVVYQDAGTYKCVGQSAANRKKLEVLQTVSIAVKGAPTVIARNTTPVAFPGSPLHLAVEFCANPPAYAARWLHGDLVYTPGKKYGDDVLAYGFIDLPTPFCKEARLTYVHMHEKVPRTFYFIVSSPGGVAEAIFNVNFTLKHKASSSSSSGPGSSSSSGGGGGSGTFGSVGPFGSSLSSAGGSLSSGGSGYKINTNTINNLPPNGNGLGDGGDGDEELMEPEEIHFPIFGSGAAASWRHFTATTAITTAATIATTTTTTIATTLYRCYSVLLLALLTCFRYVLY